MGEKGEAGEEREPQYTPRLRLKKKYKPRNSPPSPRPAPPLKSGLRRAKSKSTADPDQAAQAAVGPRAARGRACHPGQSSWQRLSV